MARPKLTKAQPVRERPPFFAIFRQPLLFRQSHLRWWPLEASKGFHFAMAKKPSQEIEFHPDAMERFERAVKVVAKSPPQHRVAKKAANKTKAKKKPGK
jgi:hypothetical protein